MEQIKYFIPNIEDLRIGYEYEIASIDSESYTKGKLTNHLMSHILGAKLRVPYLTKEQIENEGWEEMKEIFLDRRMKRCSYKKDNYFLVLDYNNQTPFIEIILRDPSLERRMLNPENFRITLPCKSINEFKQIFKFLNTK